MDTRELCALCESPIDVEGLDPCRAEIWSRDENQRWTFFAHANCVRGMLDPDRKYGEFEDEE
jgi:hypothetical protein